MTEERKLTTNKQVAISRETNFPYCTALPLSTCFVRKLSPHFNVREERLLLYPLDRKCTFASTTQHARGNERALVSHADPSDLVVG